MRSPASNVPSGNGKQPDVCLLQTAADAFRDEPALEAISLDRQHRTVAIATLGRVDKELIKSRVQAGLESLPREGSGCGLLDGTGTCAGCLHPTDSQFANLVQVQHQGCSTTLSRKTCPTAPRFWRWHSVPWPRFVQRQFELIPETHGEAHGEEDWRLQAVAACLCGVFALAGSFTQGSAWSIVFYLAAFLSGGWFAVEEVLEKLRERAIDVHFLMIAVAVGSAAIGAWGEGATLLFLFSFSGALEHYAIGRTRREIRSLFHAAPKVACIVDSAGLEREVAVSALVTGLVVRVRPGGQFPADSILVAGTTAADESNLTGESIPVDKRLGDEVFAGTINTWGAVDVRVIRPPGNSALEKIIRLIQDAQRQKAPSQRFTDKFSAVYTYAVLVLALVMFFVWWLGFGLAPFASIGETRSAFYRTMTLLVVASPCALVLSIPSAVLAAIAGAARRGVLFRGGAAVEKLAEIQLVALDKTGTLTTGELGIAGVDVLEGAADEVQLLKTAFAIENMSDHPLARAVVRHGRHQGWTPAKLDHMESVTGRGIHARIGPEPYWVGAREWVLECAGRPNPVGAPVASAGTTEVWVAGPGVLGRIRMRDEVRPQARGLVEKLRSLGLRSVVLTGDKPAAAELLKGMVPLDEVRAGLKPEDKVAALREWTASGIKTAMVGDGVNDAPSLAAAHVGIAMGARGSDAALEQADVVLMHDRLESFLVAYDVSRRARRIIRQNLVISLGTVVVLVLFALAGSIPLTLGVVGHEGSTVVVVLNSLRLLMR